MLGETAVVPARGSGVFRTVPYVAATSPGKYTTFHQREGGLYVVRVVYSYPRTYRTPELETTRDSIQRRWICFTGRGGGDGGYGGDGGDGGDWGLEGKLQVDNQLSCPCFWEGKRKRGVSGSGVCFRRDCSRSGVTQIQPCNICVREQRRVSRSTCSNTWIQ